MSAGRTWSREVLEDLRVAEELGDLDQEAADQPGVLLRVALQLLRVAGKRGAPRCAHPAPQSPVDGRGLVGAEVDAAPLPDAVQQLGVLLALRAVGRRRGRRQEVAQDRPDAVEVGVASTSDGGIERGIEGNIAVAGFSMTTAPPACLTCHAPAAPSLPLPVRMTAVSPGP